MDFELAITGAGVWQSDCVASGWGEGPAGMCDEARSRVCAHVTGAETSACGDVWRW
jgi:hypothetical protein